MAFDSAVKNATAERLNTYVASDTTDFKAVTILLVFLLVPIGIASNVIIILSWFRNGSRIKRMKFLFLVSLAFTDSLTIFLMIAYSVYFLVPSARSKQSYLVLSSLHIFLCANSQLHNIAISVERAIAIKFPLRHRIMFTSSQRKQTVVIVWMVSVVLFMFSVLRGAIFAQVFKDVVFWLLIATCFVSPLIVTFVGYCVIFVTAIRSSKANSSLTKHVCLATQRQRWKEIRLFLGISLMVLPILSCWSVFFICTIYEAVEKAKFSGLMDWILTFLPFIVACLNPVLYLLGTRSLREKNLGSKIFSSILLYIRTSSFRPNNEDTL